MDDLRPAALVLGGGIGGLTAAIALERAGVLATINERRGEVEDLELGGGIILWPNAMRVMRQLGLDGPIQSAGAVLRRAEARSVDDRRLARLPLADLEQAHGARAVGISRSALFRVLRGALRPDSLHLGRRATAFEEGPGHVDLRFEDGSAARGAFLVAADGRHSMVRTQLGRTAADFPPSAGYTLWRAATDASADREAGTFTITWGCGEELYAFPMGDGRTYWSLAVFGASGGEGPAAPLDEVRARVGGWSDRVRALVEATPPDAVRRSAISGGVPVPEWGSGLVTLLGDAAHPMTTTLGQGACQAIEDALVLARTVAGASDVPAALRRYEAERSTRTAEMMQVARTFEQPSRSRSRVACFLRDRGVGVIFSRPALLRRSPYWSVMSRPV